MRILGIDPGSRRVGYGIIDATGSLAQYIAAEILTVYSKDDVGAIGEIKTQLVKIINDYKPDVAALEKLFFVRNQKTGIAVAQARGVILSCCLEHQLPLYEFAPSEVKVAVAGNGGADKRAVLKMVRYVLKKPELSVIDDASDALALAITCASHMKLQERLS